MIPLMLGLVAVLLVMGVAASRRLRSRSAMRLILYLGIVAVIFVTSPVTVAWAIWLAADVRCGRQPVEADRFAGAYTYDLPADSNYGPGVFPIIVPDYYCSEADAKAGGYHRDPIR